MSIQSQLNNQAIRMLPLTFTAILNASEYNANQIKAFTVREIMNSQPCLDDMSKEQLNKFDNDLISSLKFMDYI